MLPEIVGSVIRAALQALSGGLITQGVATGDDINAVSGAITMLLTVAWSIWQKKKAKGTK